MASLLLISALLGVCAAVNVITTDKSERTATIVRRESTHVDPAGHVKMMINAQNQRHKHKHQEPTECDRQFLLMAEGTDSCTGSGGPEEILFEGDCDHASTVLGIPKADNSSGGYFLNNYIVNPLPYPKGCFVNTTTNKIHFNPEESNTTGVTLTGKKICVRNKYINGTADSNPDSGCSGDAVAILTYDDCWAAATCAAGGGACKLQAFKENVTTYKQDDRPQGCFKDSLGCWGFNYIESSPTGTLNGTSVCLNVVPDAQKVGGSGGAAAAKPAAKADGLF